MRRCLLMMTIAAQRRRCRRIELTLKVALARQRLPLHPVQVSEGGGPFDSISAPRKSRTTDYSCPRGS
jgi:hypothetical protein